MDPILRRGTSILFGARPRAVSLAGRPLPANPHERYPLVYAKVALGDALASHLRRRRIRRVVSVPEVGQSRSATSDPGQKRHSRVDVSAFQACPMFGLPAAERIP